MIQPPHRSVTRFFIPLIDVLTLLFCIFLLMPYVKPVEAEAGVLVYLPPRERHEVRALTDARVLLLLTPWPGSGHPGTMTLEQKAEVRARAAERAN